MPDIYDEIYATEESWVAAGKLAQMCRIKDTLISEADRKLKQVNQKVEELEALVAVAGIVPRAQAH